MNTDKATTIVGTMAGGDLLVQSLQKLVAEPSVPNAIHVVAALCIIAWAFFTNKSSGPEPGPEHKA